MKFYKKILSRKVNKIRQSFRIPNQWNSLNYLFFSSSSNSIHYLSFHSFAGSDHYEDGAPKLVLVEQMGFRQHPFTDNCFSP